jgi:hypothetical protein
VFDAWCSREAPSPARLASVIRCRSGQGRRRGWEQVAHLVGEEGQVEQAELDPAAALVAGGVQSHQEAGPASEANFECLAGLRPSCDRAVQLKGRLAAAFHQRQPDPLGGLLPFTTILLGRTSDNPLAVTLFSANLLLISLTLAWLARTAEHAGVAEPVSDGRQLLMTRARRITTATLIVAIAGLAWVIPPGRAELLFLLLYLADVPGRLLVRRRERQIPGWLHNASTGG